jgi:hypothetical protein
MGSGGDVSATELDCIYIPMIEREIDDLRFVALGWRIFPPLRGDGRKVDLLISFDRVDDLEAYRWVVDLFDGLGFSSVNILSAELSEKDAIYIRDGSSCDEKLPAMGCKSGPNMHWMWNQEYIDGRYGWSLQYEVDVIPVSDGWFDEIRRGLNENWLISGAIYRGPTRLGPRVINHVNGNAFYNSGHHLHKDWVEYTRRCIEILIEDGDSSPAFDVAPYAILGRFYSDGAVRFFDRLKGTFCCNEDMVRAILMSIGYSERIWNFAGSVEGRDEYILDFDKEKEVYGSRACLVHSQMYRYWLLGEILKNSDIISLEDKKFVCEYAAKKLFRRDRRREIYRKYIEGNDYIEKVLVDSFISPIIWRSSAPLNVHGYDFS